MSSTRRCSSDNRSSQLPSFQLAANRPHYLFISFTVLLIDDTWKLLWNMNLRQFGVASHDGWHHHWRVWRRGWSNHAASRLLRINREITMRSSDLFDLAAGFNCSAIFAYCRRSNRSPTKTFALQNRAAILRNLYRGETRKRELVLIKESSLP